MKLATTAARSITSPAIAAANRPFFPGSLPGVWNNETNALRRALSAFYRMDHVYSVIEEFRDNYCGPFAILEFGVADGYSFTKKIFATQ